MRKVTITALSAAITERAMNIAQGAPFSQVLHGDLEEAVCQHALYYALWLRYGALPERYNWKTNAPDVSFYPLRPEFMEATYFLYQVRAAQIAVRKVRQ